MATPNIVPRSDSEGGLGTASKYWASAYIDTITTTGNVTVGGTLQAQGDTAVNFNLYRSGTGQLWNFGIDSSGRLQLKEAASLGGTKNLRLQIDDDGEANFYGDITTTASNAIISASESGGATTRIMGASVGRVGTSSNHDLEIQSNSTTAITIDTSQKVGIGTSTPEAVLTIKGDPGNTNQPARITNSAQDTHTGLFLNSKGNAVDEKYGMQFGGFNEYSIGGIFGVLDSTSGSTSGDITIDMSDGTTANALIERVRFTHEGNVLMTSDDATLTLHAPASPFTPKIDFVRNSATFGDDAHTDYRLIDTGGSFKIQSGHKPSGGSSVTRDMLVLSGDANSTATLVGIPFYSGPEGNSMYTHDVSGTDSQAQYNAAYGFLAMDAITEGDFNTAIGYAALSTETKGSRNVAIGSNALNAQNNTSSLDTYNTAMGYAAGQVISTGSQNTLIGGLAGDSLTTGDNNVALGYNTLTSANTNESGNIAIGANSLNSLDNGVTTYTYNTAIGHNTGGEITTGTNNTLVGGLAGDGISLGSHNVALGYNALSATNAGSKSIAIGSGALQVQQPAFTQDSSSTTAGSATVTFPANSSVITGLKVDVTAGTDQIPNNTFVGAVSAGSPNSTFEMVNANGDEVVATGSGTVSSLTLTFTGGVEADNVAVGHLCGTSITTGVNNTLVGSRAGSSLTSGSNNVAIGYKALNNQAIQGQNVAIGNSALLNQNVSGHGNNVAVGLNAGVNVTTGTQNTLVGSVAGDTITIGASNTVIGFNADPGSNSLSNMIIIGANATNSGSNTTTIGTDATTRAKIYGKLTSVFHETVTGLGGGLDGVELGQVQIGSYNSEVITTIYLDLGQGGATDIVSSSTAGDVIGENDAAAAYATQITTAKNGVIYKAELICMETPVGGDTDINVTLHASSLAEDAAGESGGHVIVNGGAQAIGRHSTGDAAAIEAAAGAANDYLYLTHGGTTAGTYTAGKFLIRLFGVTADGL